MECQTNNDTFNRVKTIIKNRSPNYLTSSPRVTHRVLGDPSGGFWKVPRRSNFNESIYYDLQKRKM